MAAVAAEQRQQAEQHQRVLQHLTDQQWNMLDQLVVAQAESSQQL